MDSGNTEIDTRIIMQTRYWVDSPFGGQRTGVLKHSEAFRSYKSVFDPCSPIAINLGYDRKVVISCRSGRDGIFAKS